MSLQSSYFLLQLAKVKRFGEITVGTRLYGRLIKNTKIEARLTIFCMTPPFTGSSELTYTFAAMYVY
jgi:hypothetical protein